MDNEVEKLMRCINMILFFLRGISQANISLHAFGPLQYLKLITDDPIESLLYQMGETKG
jgi:hypothetical protein